MEKITFDRETQSRLRRMVEATESIAEQLERLNDNLERRDR